MPKTKAQMSMDDRIVTNPELEAKLEERQRLKEGVSAYNESDKAKGLIEALNEPMPYRIGRFIIAKTERAPRSVAFETQGGASVSIKTADEK